MIKKIDLSDLLLEPENNDIISSKKIHIALFLVICLILLSIYIALPKDVLEESISLEKSGKSVIIKKDKLDNVFVKNKITPLITKKTRFIQVSAYLNTSKDFSVIKSLNKYNYEYKVITGEKYTRVIVGPYTDFNEATTKIDEIKQRIKKDSFITSKFK